jgi:DNA relaxase NicK
LVIEKTLDWCQWTFEADQPVMNALPHHDVWRIAKQGKPLFGVYNYCWELKNGALIMWSSMNKAVGIHVVASGEPLRISRDAGYRDEQLLNHVNYARSVSRVDVALTSDYFTMEQVVKATLAGRYESRMKADQIITDPQTGGTTVYFGAKTSDKRIALYDKAKQLGLLGEALVRVEMRLRNDYASQFAFNAQAIPYRDLASNMVKNSLRFPTVPGYGKVIDNRSDYQFHQLPQKATSLERWIENQIKPAFEKRRESERGTIEEFLGWMNTLLEP